MGFLLPVAGAIGGAVGGGGGFGTFTSLIGGALGAIGSIAEGNAAAAQANYQAQIAEMNQQIAEDNAARRRDVAQLEAQQQDDQTRQLLGQQLAAQSASGVSLGSRSSLGARRAARSIGRRDALNLIQSGELDAFNSLTDAANFEASAGAQRMAASNSRLAGFLGAANSLIGTAGSLGRNARSTGIANPIGRRRPSIA